MFTLTLRPTFPHHTQSSKQPISAWMSNLPTTHHKKLGKDLHQRPTFLRRIRTRGSYRYGERHEVDRDEEEDYFSRNDAKKPAATIKGGKAASTLQSHASRLDQIRLLAQ